MSKLKEVFFSSLPLLGIIIIVFCVKPMPLDGILKVSVGYVLVVVGQALFLIGLESSIIPIGKIIGSSLIKLKKAIFIIAFGLIFGVLATVAEPALAVMAGQVSAINSQINRLVFIWLLGIGVGVAVGFALFRVLKNMNLKIVFFLLYVAVFIMVFLTPNQFVALAFDASGATTGDVSVPFILALGMGVSTTMSKAKTNDESFGIVGLASVGPIIAVFIYGMILKNNPVLHEYTAGQGSTFVSILLDNLLGVVLAITPVIAIFALFQFLFIKLPKKQLAKILISSLVVFAGLFVFLVGIDFGFAYAGKYIGDVFTDVTRPSWFKWILLAIGFTLGFSITLSEPAVTVLGEQVEDITNGYIKKRTIRLTLAIGIGFAGFISILKILTDINILYFLTPLYVISLLLMLFTPKLFVGLAFDSGGVTGGAITSAFLTPLTLGISQMLGQEILTSGFGMIAFISVTPLIAVQVLGIMYSAKMKKIKTQQVESTVDDLMRLTESFGENNSGGNDNNSPADNNKNSDNNDMTIENDINTETQKEMPITDISPNEPESNVLELLGAEES